MRAELRARFRQTVTPTDPEEHGRRRAGALLALADTRRAGRQRAVRQSRKQQAADRERAAASARNTWPRSRTDKNMHGSKSMTGSGPASPSTTIWQFPSCKTWVRSAVERDEPKPTNNASNNASNSPAQGHIHLASRLHHVELTAHVARTRSAEPLGAGA